ncbi:MAG TPA: TIGR03435 family protein [Candidatus Solibacter sp.]|nr:TIGR03435 family protein [Candidatus Solibacter sp.]
MLLLKQHRALILLAGVSVLRAQEFEVVSVKPSQANTNRFTMAGGPGTNNPGRIVYTNVMLKRVLLAAYDLAAYQITGPDWLDTQRYDIAATIPGGTTKEQFQVMLRNLLASRFQMASHGESREIPIYALLPAKGGVKVRGVPAGQSAPQTGELPIARGIGKDGLPDVTLPIPGQVIDTVNGRSRLLVKDMPLTKLAEFLTGRMDKPVIDKTGLPGVFTYALYFRPDNVNADDAVDPGIAIAIQEQLGLRMEATRSAVEFLVIDHVEKTPIGN